VKVTHSIDKPRRWIITRAEGCVAFDDIRDHQDRLLADPNFDPTFDQLIDTTPAIVVDITPDEARILAARPIVSPSSCRAFVATKPHIFGLGRMMQVYHVDLGYADAHVFYSMGEALSWLAGRPPRIR
jgi:hypothetical protein